jgi:hypothetical protein
VSERHGSRVVWMSEHWLQGVELGRRGYSSLLGRVGAVTSTWTGTFGRLGDWGSESSEEWRVRCLLFAAFRL